MIIKSVPYINQTMFNKSVNQFSSTKLPTILLLRFGN